MKNYKTRRNKNIKSNCQKNSYKYNKKYQKCLPFLHRACSVHYSPCNTHENNGAIIHVCTHIHGGLKLYSR